ncbi:MAG: thioredoxin domain-containing protein [Minisyncoccia bacterium]
MKSSYTIPIAIICGGLIIAFAVYVSMPKSGAGTSNPSLIRPVTSSDHILGNPAAKVMVVEYSDFDCDFCKRFNDTMHQLIANEAATGQVAWVYREFPLTEIHPDALSLAKAAECAAEVAGNDAFWKFADALFAAQPANPANLGTLAKSAGISGDAFATCYASESASTPLIQRIMADRQNALDMGAQGTPYSVILVAGKSPVVVDSALPYDLMKQLVDQALGN